METLTGKDLQVVKRFLDNGDVVAIPTETVYGLAGNALSEDAVLKIFKAKNRPHFNPLIIHLPLWKYAEKYVESIPKEAEELAMYFAPGPLTFLLPKKKNVPDLVTAGSNKVAIRIPAHPLAMQLLKLLDYPLAAPSANPFGYVSPTSARHVYDGLQGKIPYILDGGNCNVGVESTIVDFENGKVIIRRNGGISKQMIEEALGKHVEVNTAASDHPVAPGQLKSHYATDTPLYAGDINALRAIHAGKKIIQIGFGDTTATVDYNLSETGNADEAAKNLFAMLRTADKEGADVIIASLLPDVGLGVAVNDRLLRARHEMKGA